MRSKKILFIIILITFILLNLTLVYSTNKNNLIKEKFLRVHVVANSDEISDQILKLKVADSINNYLETLLKNSSDKDSSKKIIVSNIDNILNRAKLVIQENGYDYGVSINLGDIYYTEKSKNNISMPEGIYDSLKVIIGDGNGENWWSLIYPTEMYNNKKNNENTIFSFKFIEIIEALIQKIQEI